MFDFTKNVAASVTLTLNFESDLLVASQKVAAFIELIKARSSFLWNGIF